MKNIRPGTLWIVRGNNYTVLYDGGNYLRISEDGSGREFLQLRNRDGSFDLDLIDP